MTPESQVLLSVGIPTIAVLVGILLNNGQIDSLRHEIREGTGSLEKHVDSQISSLRSEINARFDAAHQALLRVEHAAALIFGRRRVFEDADV